ncbi:hypothetical protein AVEN_85231-1 [Araneus ventricosus]|uniref:Uncharacterized protein n=1 Tax=Araneus ventricosus TaxID=182803 RepID=A0A4Y2ECI4_ARAVE|nr:hypothetical protein AVEN_85231-1 [Araneus ventricosus]
MGHIAHSSLLDEAQRFNSDFKNPANFSNGILFILFLIHTKRAEEDSPSSTFYGTFNNRIDKEAEYTARSVQKKIRNDFAIEKEKSFFETKKKKKKKVEQREKQFETRFSLNVFDFPRFESLISSSAIQRSWKGKGRQEKREPEKQEIPWYDKGMKYDGIFEKYKSKRTSKNDRRSGAIH